jgi:hypothetical protein
MTGPELSTFATEVNGGDAIGDTLLFQLLNLAKAMVEQRRPWMLLRKTDTSVTVSAGNTWQTAISLSGLTRFSRFYGDWPIRLFDGNNRIERYRQVPFEDRLEYKDTPNTFCYDEASQVLYLNGTGQAGGTLYIHHIQDSADITNDDSSTWIFPSWSHPLLGFMAVAINKGGIDFDDVNARMAPDNRAQAELLTQRLEGWDAEKQLSATQQTDPYNQPNDGWRPGAINMN